ncbi:MAG: serine/threonine protein phosphatase 1 [Paracoccaceae bacterium]|jgi:serine/threonine protein phosphatase 1
MRSYAIGDIHGHLNLLTQAHDLIVADRMAINDQFAPVIHVGDLVDRGPNARAVIEYLSQGISHGEPWVVLKGNHDRMFLFFLDDFKAQDRCLRPDLSYLHPRIGGAATLASYGVENAADRPIGPVHAEALAAVPQAHRDFLSGCPCCYERAGVLYVHAGIRPGVALDQQIEDDLTWIREPFLSDLSDHGHLVVHGHTALDAPFHYGNRINLDSGAAYGGALTAVVIEDHSVYVLGSQGRQALLPKDVPS